MTAHRTMFGGRLRRSTAAVLVAFVAVLALYLAVRPAGLVAERTGELIPLSEARDIVEREQAREQAADRARRSAEDPRPSPTPTRSARGREPAPPVAPSASPSAAREAPPAGSGGSLLDLLGPEPDPSTEPEPTPSAPPTLR
ncbi:MAG: hypothetical protein ACT4PP_13070 [Sporichthyaceae bacterium]